MSTINRKVRQYKDFNILFTAHPVSKDVTKVTDEDAIKASVRNLLTTNNYERPFHPEIGCQLYGLLFENFTPLTRDLMIKTVYNTIEKFEPRVTLTNVNINEDVDSNQLIVDVYFRIKNTEKPVTLTTAITRVR